MKVLYIYRSKALGFSIAKVFHPIEEEMRKYAEVDSAYLPEPGAKPWQLWRNIKVARSSVAAKDYDVVHITGGEYYLTPFLKGNHKLVVTVHDLGFFTNFRLTPRTLMLYWLWIKPLRKADRVTCISEKTMEEVKKYVHFAPGQICTVHNPVGKEFCYRPKEFNSTCPVVLHLGTRPHKNLNNTILALKDLPCRLRIIGKLSKEQELLLDTYHINYSSVSNLTDDEIVREYIQCDMVNFPSLYEGFGMSIIEGQAVGRVVVTSNLSPMKEVAGNAAVLIDPTSLSSMQNGYNEAMVKHASLVEAGLENVKRFRCDVITKDYYSVYKDITG
ncbi:MAG: glycosyltransferase family 1 protein [Prevotella sp.]|nr:glycosyltransferase family 1 protein [Prevotella sp.]